MSVPFTPFHLNNSIIYCILFLLGIPNGVRIKLPPPKTTEMSQPNVTAPMTDNWRTLPTEGYISWALQSDTGRSSLTRTHHTGAARAKDPDPLLRVTAPGLGLTREPEEGSSGARARFRHAEGCRAFARWVSLGTLPSPWVNLHGCADTRLVNLRRSHSTNLALWQDTTASEDGTLAASLLDSVPAMVRPQCPSPSRLLTSGYWLCSLHVTKDGTHAEWSGDSLGPETCRTTSSPVPSVAKALTSPLLESHNSQ